MAMVLNHYFTLVDKSFPQKQDLLDQGFKLTGPRCHEGQGASACRIYIFSKKLHRTRMDISKLLRHLIRDIKKAHRILYK